MSRKRVPLRTCVVCGEAYGKRELVRVVRTPQGRVVLDTTGKTPGRGAYLCRKPSCWDMRVAVPRLQRALRATLDEDARAALEAYARTIEPNTPATVGEN